MWFSVSRTGNITLPHHYGNSRALWDHTVLPATIPVLTPAKACTQFSNPRGMQGWVDLGTAVSVQPMHKTAYCSGHRDKHDRLSWDSNLGPLTL